MSRPGSTSAPCGSLAMVASSLAVAGIEPVEPAAITGASLVGEALGLGLDQSVAPLGRLDGVPLGEEFAPARVDEFEEVERLLASIRRGPPAPACRDCPRAPGAWSCRPSAAPARRRAPARPPAYWRSAARLAPGAMAAAHAEIEFGQRQPPLQRAEGRRQRERGFREVAGGGFGKGDFVFVEIAERDDARQDGGVGLRVRRGRPRAPGGRRAASADRAWRVPSSSGSSEAGKPGTSLPARSASISTAQKRRRGGDIEDVWLCGRHS